MKLNEEPDLLKKVQLNDTYVMNDGSFQGFSERSGLGINT